MFAPLPEGLVTLFEAEEGRRTKYSCWVCGGSGSARPALYLFVPATFSPALNKPLPLLIDGTMCHIFVASITFHPLLGARPARKHEHKSNPRNSCPTLPNIPQTKSRTSPQDGLQFPSPRANRPSSQMQLPTWRTKTNALTPFNGVTLGHLSWIVHRNSRELCSVGSRILEDSCRC